MWLGTLLSLLLLLLPQVFKAVRSSNLSKSQSSSLNASNTNLLKQLAVNDKQGRNNPYGGFFTPSPPSPPSPSRRSPLEPARDTLFKSSSRQNNDGIGLQRRLPPIAHVPFTKRKNMYYSKQQALLNAEKNKANGARKAQVAKNERKNKNTLARSSQPWSNVTQQPVGPPQVQSSSGP